MTVHILLISVQLVLIDATVVVYVEFIRRLRDTLLLILRDSQADETTEEHQKEEAVNPAPAPRLLLFRDTKILPNNVIRLAGDLTVQPFIVEQAVLHSFAFLGAKG